MKQKSKAKLPNLTLVDRAISYFSPSRGLRRLQARAVMAITGSYIGARTDRRATELWSTFPGSADDETLPDLPTLRSRSRDLVRNAPLATGAILTVGMNVVGSGLSLLARPDWEFLEMTEDEADAWKKNVEREFRTWCESKDCDITRTQNFYGLQRLTFRSALESGDCFVLLPMISRPTSPYSLVLQVVEADRVANPKIAFPFVNKLENGNQIVEGVELDGNGAPVAYHVLRAHPGSIFGGKREADRIIAFGAKTGRRNVLHIGDRTRPGQTRTPPYLTPVIETLKQLDRYTEAELMAAVVTGMLAVFVTTDTGEGFGVPEGNNAAVATGSQFPLESGTITDLRPGEKVETVSSTRPNTGFDPFVKAIYEQISVALGLPFEVMIKHFTASYSAARAALLEAWKFYKMQRDILVENLCAPVYEAFLEEAVARGRVDAPGFFDDQRIRRAYLQADWIGDAQGQIDPVKEVEAAERRVALRVSSRTREAMALSGAEIGEIHLELVKEQQMAQDDGLLPSPQPQPSAPATPQNQGGGDSELPPGGAN